MSFPAAVVVSLLAVDVLEVCPSTAGDDDDDDAVVLADRVAGDEDPEVEGEGIDVPETRELAKAETPVLSLPAELADMIVLVEDGDALAKLDAALLWA